MQKRTTDLQRLVQAKAAELDILTYSFWDEEPTVIANGALDRASGGAYTPQVARPFDMSGARACSAV